MLYAVRYTIPCNILSWWNAAWGDAQVVYSINQCFKKHPGATIHITKIEK